MVAPKYTLSDASRIKSLLLRGHSVNEVATQTGFTAYTVEAAVRATEGMTISEFRHANNLTSPPAPPDPASTSKSALPRTRIPSANAEKPRSALVTKTCPFCKKQFEPRKAKQKFCSHSCSGKARVPGKLKRRITVTKTCENCGRPYDTFRQSQRYCTDECRKACISANMTWLTEIPCKFCEKLFRPKQQGYKFCSKPCAYKGKAAGSLIRGTVEMHDGSKVPYVGTYELVFLLYANKHGCEFPHVSSWKTGIPYRLAGAPHTYYPDFRVERPGQLPLMVELKSSRTIEFSPERHEAKVAAARMWCASNQHEYLLLGEWEETFREMCAFVKAHNNLDALAQRAREDSKVEDRHCVECGKVIPRKAPSIYRKRVFCSSECRNKSDKHKLPVKPSSRHICPTCNKPFRGGKQKKYCSKACYTTAQTTLLPRACAVCGTVFSPSNSDMVTCGLKCGTIYRAASRTGLTVDAYVKQKSARLAALPNQATCSRCGKAFKPSLAHRQHCQSCRDAGGDVWTLDLMLSRLREIQAYRGGQIPTYSEIYHDQDLKSRFNSCSLAGALFRFNQEHHISSYADFCERYLGWAVPRKLCKIETARVLSKLVEICGGVPVGLSKMPSVLGHRGMTLMAAIKKHFGKTLEEYCVAKKLKRVPSMESQRLIAKATPAETQRRKKPGRRQRVRLATP